MGWAYYAATLSVILVCASFCAVLLSKYRRIRKSGVVVDCEIVDCFWGYSTRMKKEFTLTVSFEYEGEDFRSSCTMRRFAYYNPKAGESMQFIYIPGKPDTLYPTRVNRYPVFNLAVMMAALALMFAAALVATIVSLSLG